MAEGAALLNAVRRFLSAATSSAAAGSSSNRAEAVGASKAALAAHTRAARPPHQPPRSQLPFTVHSGI